jgi:hypothetical protein
MSCAPWKVSKETVSTRQYRDRVRSLLEHRASAVQVRRAEYQNWCGETRDLLAERRNWVEQHISRRREQGVDYGIEL